MLLRDLLLGVLFCFQLSVSLSIIPHLEERILEVIESNMKLYLYPQIKGDKRIRFTKSHRMYWELETQLWNLIPQNFWTNSSEEADFFVVRHLLYGHWDRKRTQQHYIKSEFGPSLIHMVDSFPYYNQSDGSNHLIVYVGDNGPNRDCIFDPLNNQDNRVQAILRNMTKIGYYGRTDEAIHEPLSEWRPKIDIAMPMFNDYYLRSSTLSSIGVIIDGIKTNQKRTFFFRGNLGHGKFWCQNQLLKSCSAGIRPWIGRYFRNVNVVDEEILSNDRVHNISQHVYLDEGGQPKHTTMASGWTALCPAGVGCWSSRLFDAIYSLTIPIILSDYGALPFEQFLNFDEFSYQFSTYPLLQACNENNTFYEECLAQKKITLNIFQDIIAQTIDLKARCRQLPLSSDCLSSDMVSKLMKLEQVRDYFSYDPNNSNSAWGMFLLELYQRRR